MASNLRKSKFRPIWDFPGFGGLTVGFFAFLYVPILVLVAYSFNGSKFAMVWSEFSWRWYLKLLENDDIHSAAINSLIVAFFAAPAATIMATLAALVMVRGGPFRSRAFTAGLITLPLMVPEIVTAVATLIFFSVIGFDRGLLSILLAHIVFCIPFAYLPISARLQGISSIYEQAGRDLYATPGQTFRLILFPLMVPGILSGFLLAFIISLDDFIITNFVKGAGVETLPTAIFGAVKQGIKPNIMAISTLMLTVSIVLVSISYLISRMGRQE